MKKKPVSSKVYDKKWINTAWGINDTKLFIKNKGKNIRPRIKKSIDIANLKNNLNILDIACGRGELIINCALRNINVYGIDYSQAVVNFSSKISKLLPKKFQKKIHIQKCNAKKLPFQNSFFDRIFLLDIVEHAHDWELLEIFKEAKRVLKKDGFIIIHTLPNIWVHKYGYQIIRFFIRKLPKDYRSDYDKKSHINEQSLPHLAKTLTKCNLKSIIWLEDMVTQHVNWKQHSNDFTDSRKEIYPILNNKIVKFIFKIINSTLLKLLFSNDIYAFAWKDKKALSNLPKISFHYTEKILRFIINPFINLKH